MAKLLVDYELYVLLLCYLFLHLKQRSLTFVHGHRIPIRPCPASLIILIYIWRMLWAFVPKSDFRSIRNCVWNIIRAFSIACLAEYILYQFWLPEVVQFNYSCHLRRRQQESVQSNVLMFIYANDLKLSNFCICYESSALIVTLLIIFGVKIAKNMIVWGIGVLNNQLVIRGCNDLKQTFAEALLDSANKLEPIAVKLNSLIETDHNNNVVGDVSTSDGCVNVNLMGKQSEVIQQGGKSFGPTSESDC